MVQLRGTTMVLLLATLTVACDKGSPTAPSPVTLPPDTPVMEPTEITITVEHPYPANVRPVPQHPGIEGATVTCLSGCDSQQIEVTDSQGVVTLNGWVLPMTIRAEKDGYITTEQQMSGDDKIFLGHEWPPEAAGSFSRLNLHPSLLLNWNEDDVLGAFYGCNVIVIEDGTRYYGRRGMLAALEHELFHAHQDETIVSGGICPQREFYERWAATDDGQEWIAATNADREAGRLVLWIDDPKQYFWTIAAESVADYYGYWILSKWPIPEDQDDTPGHVGVRDLCYEGKSLRCQYMEKRFGRRPFSYP